MERKEAKRKTYLIPVRRIVANTNPRNPLSQPLQELGYGAFASLGELPALWSLATSDHPEARQRYAKLIEAQDPELASLGATLLSVGQLEPVEVRDNGKRADGENTYTLVFGCRRCLAILYNWCVIGKPKEPVVEAFMVKGNEGTLLHRAVIENIRKDPNPIEVARAMQYALNNGETEKEIAAQYGIVVQTVKNRLALLELPLETQRRIAAGRLKPSKALELANGSEGQDGAKMSGGKARLRRRKEIEAAQQEFSSSSSEGRRWLGCWAIGTPFKVRTETARSHWRTHRTRTYGMDRRKSLCRNNRGERIRTSDLLNPIQAR